MKRMAIKFSGEYSAEEIGSVLSRFLGKLEILVICGGGNLTRGRNAKENRAYEDRIGMCSTLINSIRLKCIFGTSADIFSTNFSSDICKKYNLAEVKTCLEQNKLPILAGGLGCGYLSTDTTMVVRALELECECAIKVTKVGGVYDKDPNLFNDAKKLASLTYEEAESKSAFDKVSVILAQENQLPFVVVDMHQLAEYLEHGSADCSVIA